MNISNISQAFKTMMASNSKNQIDKLIVEDHNAYKHVHVLALILARCSIGQDNHTNDYSLFMLKD